VRHSPGSDTGCHGEEEEDVEAGQEEGSRDGAVAQSPRGHRSLNSKVGVRRAPFCISTLTPAPELLDAEGSSSSQPIG
jgi:hypothetical protein